MSFVVTSPTNKGVPVPGIYEVRDPDGPWDATWDVMHYDGKARKNGNEGWWCVRCERIKCPHITAAQEFTAKAATEFPRKRVAATFEAMLEDFVALTKESRTLASRQKEVKEQQEKLEVVLLELFSQRAIQHLQAGGLTLYIRWDLYAVPDGNQEKACEALVQAGLGDLVKRTFSVSQLSAMVMEWLQAGTPPPAAFDGAIKFIERYRLHTRKGN